MPPAVFFEVLSIETRLKFNATAVYMRQFFPASLPSIPAKYVTHGIFDGWTVAMITDVGYTEQFYSALRVSRNKKHVLESASEQVSEWEIPTEPCVIYDMRVYDHVSGGNQDRIEIPNPFFQITKEQRQTLDQQTKRLGCLLSWYALHSKNATLVWRRIHQAQVLTIINSYK